MNYSSFAKCSDYLNKHIAGGGEKSTFKHEDYLEVGERRVCVTYKEISPPFDPVHQPIFNDYLFLEVNFQSKSFLQNQIRRMVAAAHAHSCGVVNWENFLRLFENPHPMNWNQNIKTSQPNGLHFVGVDYDPYFLKGPTETRLSRPGCPPYYFFF